MDGDRAAVVARRRRTEHGLELPATRATPEAPGDQNRVLRGGHSQPLELVDDGGKGLLTRIKWRTGKWESRRLDDDRHPPAARDEIAERWSGERIAKRLPDGRRNIPERLEGWRRHQENSIIGDADERDARAREKRKSCHDSIQPPRRPARPVVRRRSGA